MTRLFWSIICAGFYLQHKAYEWADAKRNMSKPLHKAIACLVALVAAAIVIGMVALVCYQPM